MDSPIVTATVQSGILAAISNISAQALHCWKANIPFSLDWVEFLHFVLYALMSCPPNFLWQSWLEAEFPGHADQLAPAEKEKLVDEVVAGQSTSIDQDSSKRTSQRRANPKDEKKNHVSESNQSKTPTSGLNIQNTAIKLALDNTLGAAVNVSMFVVGLGFLRSQPSSQILNDLQAQFWPMIYAGQKVWPAVSVISFTLVPVQYRTTFGSIVGLFWGVYMSMLTSQRK